MWVSPSERGQGIAKLLIKKVISHAKELGFSSIFLEVRTTNISACKLYEILGFKLVSTSSSNHNGASASLNKLRLNLKA